MLHIKDSHSYHFQRWVPRTDRVMLFASVFAVLIHAAIIFGIDFEEKSSPTAAVQEVTTVLTENLQKNEQADFIANASQQGRGESDKKLRFENNTISPVNAQAVHETDDIVSQERQTSKEAFQESYLRTTLSFEKIRKENNNKKQDDSENLIAQEQRVQAQIATLETKISSNRQLLAKKSAVKTISSNSTTAGEAARYIENFRQQAYHIGNQQYPQEARAKGIKGDVMLMVIIEPSGQVKSIKVLRSSGSKILDEAAKNSVRKAAPFGKFSPEMNDYLELRIIRTWRFGDTLAVDDDNQ